MNEVEDCNQECLRKSLNSFEDGFQALLVASVGSYIIKEIFLSRCGEIGVCFEDYLEHHEEIEQQIKGEQI
jgi:hypothetical protein